MMLVSAAFLGVSMILTTWIHLREKQQAGSSSVEERDGSTDLWEPLADFSSSLRVGTCS